MFNLPDVIIENCTEYVEVLCYIVACRFIMHILCQLTLLFHIISLNLTGNTTSISVSRWNLPMWTSLVFIRAISNLFS